MVVLPGPWWPLVRLGELDGVAVEVAVADAPAPRLGPWFVEDQCAGGGAALRLVEMPGSASVGATISVGRRLGHQLSLRRWHFHHARAHTSPAEQHPARAIRAPQATASSRQPGHRSRASGFRPTGRDGLSGVDRRDLPANPPLRGSRHAAGRVHRPTDTPHAALADLPPERVGDGLGSPPCDAQPGLIKSPDKLPDGGRPLVEQREGEHIAKIETGEGPYPRRIVHATMLSATYDNADCRSDAGRSSMRAEAGLGC